MAIVDVNIDLPLRVQEKFTLVGHGFVVGNPIIVDITLGTFKLARASSTIAGRWVGVVTTVIDADNFIISTSGFITTGVPAYPASTVVYVSPTVAGGVTDTEPVRVSIPVMIVLVNGVSAFLIPSIDAKSIKQWFFGDYASTVAASLTRFGFVIGSTGTPQVTESLRQNIALGGNYSQWTANIVGTQSLTGSLVLTFRQASADTTLVITIPAGSATGFYSDLVNIVTIGTDVPISVKVENNASATSTTLVGWKILYNERTL